ncbi:MAG: IPT/TIG domain-containing protein [Acidobacteriota bacterium]
MYKRSKILLALVAAVAMLAACSGDNPTEPEQSRAAPGDGPSAGATVYNVSVSSTANSAVTGSPDALTITVDVRVASDGSKPPNGTNVAIQTSLGDFNSANSGVNQGTLSLFDGIARINFFAGNTPGTARITAQIQQSRGSTNVTIGDRPTFFVESITPNIGAPDGGEQVQIRGGGFLDPVRVSFDGNDGVVESVNDSIIRVRTPAIALQSGQTQAVTVVVTNNANGPEQGTDQLVNAFTYTFGGSSNVPRAFSVTPGTGPNEGGTQVVITGENFESPVQVIFGQGNAPNAFNGLEATVLSASPTRLVVQAPSATDFGQGLLNQRVDILIRNLNTGLVTIFTDSFQYGPQVLVTEIAPNSGPASGDQLVTIFGQGFVEPLQVRLGSVVDPQSLVSVTPTEISIRTLGAQTASCGNISGPVIVTLLDTGNENTQGPTYVYEVPGDGPQLSSISPTQGAAVGGTSVAINGSNFYTNMQVTFGGRPGDITSTSESRISVRSPFLADAEFLTESCDDNADGAAGERYIETPVDIVVTNLSTTCQSTFPGGFVYSPPTTACRNDVGEVEAPVASFTSTSLGGLSVQFNDTSSGAPTAWAWDFENDGINDDTRQFPDFTFPAAGTYAVRLTVTNAGGSDTTVQTITVP